MEKEHIEIQWKNEQLMRGYHDKGNRKTVVIVVHGIGGNKLGHKYIFKQFAEQCKDRKLSTIRVDFIGSGESDGNFHTTKHSEQISQVEAMVAYARKLGYENIVLCSTTIGCYPLWHYAKSDDEIKLIINWNPITDFAKYKKDQLVTKNNGYIDMNGLWLSSEYINDVKSLDENIPPLNCEVYLIQGINDYEFVTGHAYMIANELGWSIDCLRDANHLFENCEVRNQLFSLTINKVMDKIG